MLDMKENIVKSVVKRERSFGIISGKSSLKIWMMNNSSFHNLYKIDLVLLSMKRVVILSLMAFFVFGVLSSFVFAATTDCTVNATFVSQDPYPAVPGDYVKLVFQLSGTGVSDPSCGKLGVELVDEYPLSFDSNDSNKLEVQSGVYATDYNSYFIAPFKARVSENALDGINTIKLKYSSSADLGTSSYLIKNFDLEVKDVKTDFEVSVKDYDSKTNMITFEILNIGKNNVEALVADMPVQNTLDIKGSRRNIIGSLDSNDDTTFTFEGTPKDGQISMVLSYNDKTGARRQIEKSVMFNSADFQGRVKDKKSNSGLVLVILLVAIGTGIYFWRRNRKKKELARRKF